VFLSDKAEKPSSSIMINRVFSAPLGGTTSSGQICLQVGGVRVDLTAKAAAVRQGKCRRWWSSRRASPGVTLSCWAIAAPDK
jgi:hypothetical protein